MTHPFSISFFGRLLPVWLTFFTCVTSNAEVPGPLPSKGQCAYALSDRLEQKPKVFESMVASLSSVTRILPDQANGSYSEILRAYNLLSQNKIVDEPLFFELKKDEATEKSVLQALLPHQRHTFDNCLGPCLLSVGAAAGVHALTQLFGITPQEAYLLLGDAIIIVFSVPDGLKTLNQELKTADMKKRNRAVIRDLDAFSNLQATSEGSQLFSVAVTTRENSAYSSSTKIIGGFDFLFHTNPRSAEKRTYVIPWQLDTPIDTNLVDPKPTPLESS